MSASSADRPLFRRKIVSVRGRVNIRAKVRLEALGPKYPITASRTDIAVFWI